MQETSDIFLSRILGETFPPWCSGLRIQQQQKPRLLQSSGLVSPALCSGLKDSKLQGIGCTCGLDSILGPGTSVCCGCGHKIKKKKKIPGEGSYFNLSYLWDMRREISFLSCLLRIWHFIPMQYCLIPQCQASWAVGVSS